MTKTDVPGEYKCKEGELIQIRFFCIPQRENVNIRSSFDGVNFTTVTTNSIQLLMGTSQITLRLQYAFINNGSCVNQILAISNSGSAKEIDRVTTGASAGGMDFIALIFKP